MYKNYVSKKHKKRVTKPRFGRWLVFLIIIFFIFKIFFGKIDLEQKVVITKGATFQNFTIGLSTFDKFSLKIYLWLHKDDFDASSIQEGTYIFEGTYSKSEFLDVIEAGPKHDFQKYTVLEGWSIYDIDADLTKKGLIQKGDYISFVISLDIISKYISRYNFLSEANKYKSLKSLEGFLYPDTYHLDIDATNMVDQLVYLQLENFKKKVWDVYKNDILSFDKLSWYDIVVLASVVEKEERNIGNKPTVAGIFINRLSVGMRLDADITLCYGLHEAYETCTPTMIAQKIYDKNNIYNTRQIAGLPPQPISNPAIDSILAVLNYDNTDYMFYLHDANGNIHYARTVSEHNVNKDRYLN